MSRAPLVLASELSGRPVVAIDCGDDIAEVKDIVFDPVTHILEGFTLNKRGWFRGSLKALLPTDRVAAIGAAAVMVGSARDLVASEEAPPSLAGSSDHVTVVGSQVLSADGNLLGEITDVVLETGPMPAAAGYEVDSGDGKIFVPISAQMSLSDDNLVLPEAARQFVRDDLAGFGAAVAEYRKTLDSADRPSPPSHTPTGAPA